MSQVRKLQKGGTTPNPTDNKYTVKVNGNNFDIGHEELQTWFNDYMKAGGGKTKNRDEWNSNFNELLGTIKSSNATGQSFDFDLQGDTVGAIANPEGLSNAQAGLKDDGKAAKAGILAGITGVKNQTAMRGSLLGGLADYAGRAYTNTVALNEKDAKEKEVKLKEEADKLKAEGMTNFNTRLGGFSNYLDPSSGYKSIDGKNATMDFAVTSFNKLDEKGRNAYLGKIGLAGRNEFNALYADAQKDPEMLKAFEGKFGKDGYSRLSAITDPAEWLKQANPETIGMFTDPETYNKIAQKTAPAVKFTANADGTFSNGDGKTYLDDKGTLATGQSPTGAIYDNGLLREGLNEDGLLYRKGLALTGDEGDVRYVGGKTFTGIDAPGANTQEALAGYDYGNVNTVPLRLEGKKVDFKTFYKAVESNPKYANFSSHVADILSKGIVPQQDLDSKWTKRGDLDRNGHNIYKNAPEENIPDYYRNITGNFSNFGPEKGAITEELRTNKMDAYGRPEILKWLRRNGKRELIERFEKTAVGNITAHLRNGEKVYLGKENKAGIDLKGKIYNLGTNNKVAPKQPVAIRSGNFMQDGGKLEALRTLKRQYGGAIPSAPSTAYKTSEQNAYGQGGKEQYEESSISNVLSNPQYKMTTTDKLQLGALVADIGSLAGTAVLGVGNAAAAGIGAAGTLTNLAANISKDGSQTSDWLEAGAGLGLDLLTLLPGLGTGAKSAKILRSLKYASPVIGTALAAAGAYQAQDSFRKILAGGATVDDWRHLATGLTGALSGKRMATDNFLATSKGAVSRSIKDAAGKPFPLNPNQLNALENATGPDKIKLAKQIIAQQTPGLKVEDVKLETGFGLKGWKPTLAKEKIDINTTTGDRTLDELGTNWLKNRAIKRVAMGNPGMAGADDVLGTGNKLGTTPWGRKFTWLSGNVKSEGSAAETVAGAVRRKPLLLGSGQPAAPSTPAASATKGSEDVVASAEQSAVDVVANRGLRLGTQENKPLTQIPERASPNWIKGEADAPKSAEALDIERKSNKLMNIYVPKSKKQPLEVPAEKSYVPKTTGEYPSRTMRFEDVKVKKQDKVKEVLETPSVRTTAAKTPFVKPTFKEADLVKIRRGLNIATGKEHTIELEAIVNPKKGTIQETLSKRILKDKKLAKYVEDAMDKGETSIKLAEGGVVKAVSGVKLKFKNPTDPNAISKFNRTIFNNLSSRGAGPLPETTEKPGFMSTFLKGIDKGTVSELGRAIYNRNLNKNIDTRVSVPLATNVSEIDVPVKGDLTLSSAYNRSAANLIADAGRARTSDSGIELAGRLASNKQAEDLRLQGDAANAEAIARTEGASLASQQQYAGMRNQVANTNSQALAQKAQAERQLNNSKVLAMGKSVDNFWASQNQKNYMADQQNRVYDTQIASMGADAKFTDVMSKLRGSSDTTWAAYQKALQGTDTAAIALAKKAYEEANVLGTRATNNLQYIQMQLAKDPNFDYSSLNLNDDLLTPKVKTVGSNLRFRTSSPGRFATGGKLTAEEKVALEEYKETNKNFKETTKEYNKWLSLKLKDDKKDLAIATKSIGDLIKQALK